MIGEMENDVKFGFIEPTNGEGARAVEKIVNGGTKKGLDMGLERIVYG